MKFRNDTLIMIGSIALLSVLHLLCRFPFWSIILIFLIYIIRVIDGVIHIQRNYFIDSINRYSKPHDDNNGNTICLSFDDGIHCELTSRVLDILKAENIKAMFFIIGKHIEGNETILKRMSTEGHIIGNHSYSHHFWFDLKSAEEMKLDIEKMNLIIEKELGFKPTYFRPPYGVTNPDLAKAITSSGMKSVGWNLRSKDTQATSKQQLLHKLMKMSKPGAIVLLHDRCQVTIDSLTEYIAFCKQQGYTFVTI